MKSIGIQQNTHVSSSYLKELPMGHVLGGSSQDLDTWLINMVIVSPLSIGLWDPFQMAELHGFEMEVILTV